MKLVAGAMAAMGLGLIICSFLVNPKSVSASSWTRADAEKFTKTGLKAKQLADEKSHGKPVSQAQVNEALKAHQSERTRLDSAQRYGINIIGALRWSGVGCTAIAALLYGWLKGTS